MPEYNIELRTQERIWETISVEKTDLPALRVEVAAFVGEVLKDHADKIWEDREWRIDVTDEHGLILFVMHLFVTDSAALAAPRR